MHVQEDCPGGVGESRPTEWWGAGIQALAVRRSLRLSEGASLLCMAGCLHVSKVALPHRKYERLGLNLSFK